MDANMVDAEPPVEEEAAQAEIADEVETERKE